MSAFDRVIQLSADLVIARRNVERLEGELRALLGESAPLVQRTAGARGPLKDPSSTAGRARTAMMAIVGPFRLSEVAHSTGLQYHSVQMAARQLVGSGHIRRTSTGVYERTEAA